MFFFLYVYVTFILKFKTCRNSTLPIVLKGILAPKDAKLAAECGASGIIVSSHGARQLDTAVTPVIFYSIYA